MPGYVVPLLILTLVLICVVVVLLVAMVRRGHSRRPDEALQLLHQQINALATQQDNRLAQTSQQLTTAIQNLTTNFNERLGQNHSLAQQTQRSIAERLEAAGKTIADVKGQLGQLNQATAQITQVGSEVRKLQDILQSPKLRGSLGEWSLDNLLAEVLPRQRYVMQHRFKTGNMVDALVHLTQGSVAIDAKFPLSNFQAMIEAPDDPARQKSRRVFLRDVRDRIDEIANKYILPDEGTLDFALMYVPAENVYYQATVSVNHDDLDICAYGRTKKVIPVSPNTLYAYLMVIATGLKGLQIEKNAHRIHQQLSQLTNDLTLFLNDFVMVGKHLNNARVKHDDAHRKFDNLSLRLQQMQSHSLPDQPSETH